MKRLLHVLALSALFVMNKLQAQTTYYWVGGNGGSISTTATAKDWISTNWNTSPDGTGTARTTSAGNDILIFDGNSPLLATGNKSIFIRNIPRDSCGQLRIINGAGVYIHSNLNPNQTLSGYTTSGSTSIMLTAPSYTIIPGINISGAGIPAGSTITNTGTPVSVSAAANTTSGSTSITLTAGSTSIVPGLTVSGTGVTTGSTVVSATTPTVITAIGNTSTSTTVTLAAPNSAIVVGMGITGSGIPAGTTVAAYDGNLTLTLSAATTTTVANATLTIATAQTVVLSAAATAAGTAVTLTFAGQQINISQAATATVASGSPASLTANTDLGNGTFITGTTYGGCVLPVTGTGTNFTSYFRPGDYIFTSANYLTMNQVLAVNSDVEMAISGESPTAMTAGTYTRAVSLYIKGNPGLYIDPTSTLGLGNSNSGSGFLTFVLNFLPGAKGEVWGSLNFQSRGTGAKIVASDPDALVFKSGSNCNIGIAGNKVYLFGMPYATGSVSAGTLALINNGPGISFEGGSNLRHTNVQCNSPFGNSINAASPLVFTPAVSFKPNSNYFFTYGNGYPPYFYSCNATNYNPQSAASFGNVIFNGTTIPAKSATASLFFLPKRCDTLTISSTYAGTTTYTNYINNPVAPPAYIYGTIINNSAAPLNFGKVMFMGNNATIGAGTTAPIFTHLLVGDGATLTLNGNITVTGTASSTVTVGVAPSGKLDLSNYTITGTGGAFSPNGSYNTTHNKASGSGATAGGCAVTANSNTISVRAINNIPIGAIVTSSSHPTLFPAGTMVLSYGGSGSYFLSNAATATVDSTSTPALSLTFTAAGSNTVTSNVGGLESSLLAFASANSVSGANYTFNTATTTPFNSLMASPINAGSITVNANTTLNKAIVNLSGSLNLNGVLSLRAGDSLRINSGNAITGAPFSSTKYVETKVDATTGGVGVLYMENFATARLFPVGTNGNYLPVTITPDSTAGFAVTAFNGATENGAPNGTAISAARRDTSVNANYIINRVYPNNANVHTAIVTVGFPAALMGTSFATLNNKIGISRYNGTTWDPVTGSGTISSLSATATFSAFSPFMVTKNVNAVVPVSFGTISASLTAQREVKVNWIIYTEINTDKYLVERSADGINFTQIGTVKADRSGNYHFVDASPFTGNNYYRIASLDKGSSTPQYSKVVSISTKATNAGLAVYPNPVRGKQLNIQVNDLKEGKITVLMYNQAGQTVLNKSMPYRGGVMAQSLQLPSNMLTGTYELLISDGITTLKQRVFVAE